MERRGGCAGGSAPKPLETTTDLYEAVRGAVGWTERGGNPAKRVFQAVRVHVNDELGGLERALSATERLLVPGGRLVAITFQSGEDRVVKRFISEREVAASAPRLACLRVRREACVPPGRCPAA